MTLARAADARPGILSGRPRSAGTLPVVRPVLPALESIEGEVREMLRTGILTNTGPHTERFEALLAERLDVPNPVVVANGTVALMLALEALLPGHDGEVIIPSFTFAATGNAVSWAGFEPVLADVDPRTMAIDVDSVRELIGPRTVAIMPVHPFGGLCDVDALATVAAEHDLKLVYDSAQAVGMRYRDRPIGDFGHGEAFSLHTTKVLPTGEGGMVTSRDPAVADRIRRTRNFGLGSSQAVSGLNAKITEFAALIGLRSLDALPHHLDHRRRVATRVRSGLTGVPGLLWQEVPDGVETNAQNLALRIDAPTFGLTADQLADALVHDNIHARRYFHPCLHQLPAFAHCRRADLQAAEVVTSQCLSLPLYSDMTDEEADTVIAAVTELHHHAAEIADALERS